MTAVVLDTHVLHRWSAEPERLSGAAVEAVEAADELVVSGITWWELAWLATHGRIEVETPLDAWLDGLSDQVRTAGVTSLSARLAAQLPPTFPGDPADRLIWATARASGTALVSKDRRVRAYGDPAVDVVW